MVKVIMHGCNGAMGQTITRLAEEMDGIEIIAGIDLKNDRENGYPVFSSLAECTVKADAVIDFASPKAADALFEYCKKTATPLVLCTTGLSEEQLEAAEALSRQVPVLRSANMSLGVNLLFKLVQEAAKVLADSGFDIEIVEKHHNKKKDAPSGTALALADAVNEAMEGAYHYVYNRKGVGQARDSREIGISSVRGGTIVGDHDVIFAGADEVVTLNHTAYSKAVFGKGALEAAKFLAGKEPGLYNMKHVVGL